MIDVVYLRKDLVAAHHLAVEKVAAERVYLGSVTLPPFDPEGAFAIRLIQNDWPIYGAMDGSELVGWADVVPVEGTETAHRGTLGMGVLASHRGAGIGARLLDACLAHAPSSQISKVELTVFTNNAPAIALYRKFGFTEIGVTCDYRRRDGVIYDALLMERFLGR